MNRRSLMIGSAAAVLAEAIGIVPCRAQGIDARGLLQSFDSQFAQLLADPSALEETRAYREFAYRAVSLSLRSKRRRDVARTRKSARPISERARSLIIRFEVSGEAKYDQSYRRPIWPQGESGVTIGIGYDLGYVSKSLLKADWGKYLAHEQVQILEPACRVKGQRARYLVDQLSNIDIPWVNALKQFDDFLPFVGGETEVVFPNCYLLSANAFGALVSLVYNRGSSVLSRPGDSLDRRREMKTVRDLMARKDFDRRAFTQLRNCD